jgi:hypothetical protein
MILPCYAAPVIAHCLAHGLQLPAARNVYTTFTAENFQAPAHESVAVLFPAWPGHSDVTVKGRKVRDLPPSIDFAWFEAR